jgi:hypothetical protein
VIAIDIRGEILKLEKELNPVILNREIVYDRLVQRFIDFAGASKR